MERVFLSRLKEATFIKVRLEDDAGRGRRDFLSFTSPFRAPAVDTRFPPAPSALPLLLRSTRLSTLTPS